MNTRTKTKLEILCELHNQQGGTIHQFNAMYSKGHPYDILALNNRSWFKFIYGICLKKTHAQSPNDYAWPAHELLNVYERMCAAIDKGTFNKDSQAFKTTCKALGIKHTYKAIAEFINT